MRLSRGIQAGLRQTSMAAVAISLAACGGGNEAHDTPEAARSLGTLDAPPADIELSANIQEADGALIDKDQCLHDVRSDEGEAITVGGGEFNPVLTCGLHCPEGSYAYSIAVKSLAQQGSGDDEAVTGIALGCHEYPSGNFTGTVAWTATGSGGTWSSWETCPYVYWPIFAGHVRYGAASSSDEAATTEIQVGCGLHDTAGYFFQKMLTPEVQPGTNWGSYPTNWYPEPKCPADETVCGLAVSANGSSDRVGIDMIEFHCCDAPF